MPTKTPDRIRSAKSKADLLQAGGRRLTVNLSAQAAADLAAIRAAGGHRTDRLAIEAALRLAAPPAPASTPWSAA